MKKCTVKLDGGECCNREVLRENDLYCPRCEDLLYDARDLLYDASILEREKE